MRRWKILDDASAKRWRTEYVRPEVRAQCASLGNPLSMEFADQTITPPAHEVPGELAWYERFIDLSSCLVAAYLLMQSRNPATEEAATVEIMEALQDYANLPSHVADLVGIKGMDIAKKVEAESPDGLREVRAIYGLCVLEMAHHQDKLVGIFREASTLPKSP